MTRWAAAIACAWAFAFPNAAAAVTIDFEQHPAGTVITDQYAGQGVVFGPLPGGAGDGYDPVVRMPPAGQAQSGAHVADIANCPACEFFQPKTTGTFDIPRSRVSVAVGYLGEPTLFCADIGPACAVVTLRAFDANGQVVGESSVEVFRGGGVHAVLSATAATASIVGFEISGRPMLDDSKLIAIDDLTFESPAQQPPPMPDFTLNPATPNVIVANGDSATVPITIGRLGGSSGGIALSAAGLPDGVSASFSPAIANGTQSTLTVTAAVRAGSSDQTVTVTGTPQSASVGPGPRSFPLRVTVQERCKPVATAFELRDALAAGYKCVFVRNDASINMNDLQGEAVAAGRKTLLEIPAGVKLLGGRSPTEHGGVLRMSKRPPDPVRAMLELGAGTVVSGVRLRGYHFDPVDRDDLTSAIIVPALDVRIENNEFWGWPHAGVRIDRAPNDQQAAGRIRITRNFFHDNPQCNLGYGVVVYFKGFARIDHNLFNFNRHDVAGGGAPGTGYVADHNFALTSGPKCAGAVPRFPHYNQHFDMHGVKGDGTTAGTYMEIVQNTIRGAQIYGLRGYRQRRGTFWLRGTPTGRAIFAGNVVHHPGHGVAVKGLGIPAHGGKPAKSGIDILKERGKLRIHGNSSCVDTAGELAVGDFNGDRVADVFQAVGTVWVYSPSGRREWHMLNDSSLRLDQLGLGDFDGDGRTDVFTARNGSWFVSFRGTGGLVRRPVRSNLDVKQFRFGDFDGDGKTDVFRASGAQFFISSAAATEWRPLEPLRVKVGDLRFGDFDGDGRTDVFSLAKGQWSISRGADSGWDYLNRKLSANLRELAFGDFNGDGRTDVARSSAGKWQVSWGGTTEWRLLRNQSGGIAQGTLIADFDGDQRADVLRHNRLGSSAFTCAGAPGTFARYKLSSGGSGSLRDWSLYDMN